jgi:hypothetical protein
MANVGLPGTKSRGKKYQNEEEEAGKITRGSEGREMRR